MKNRNKAAPKIEIKFGPDFEDRYIKACIEVMQARSPIGGKENGTAYMRFGDSPAFCGSRGGGYKSDIPA